MRNFDDKNWNKQYGKLVEFKRKNGHCLVPRRYPEDASLGRWVAKQRETHVTNKLRLDREGLLEEIGFVWRVDLSVRDETGSPWKKQYEKLVEFKRKNGHCLVPKKWPEDASLGTWVDTQRQFHSENKLRLDRKGLLEELGFVWNVVETKWNTHYEKLVEFKQKNDHCNVPRGYKEDGLSLGIWVSNQRQRKNNMRQDRKGLLEELGFAWKAGTVAARSSTADVSYRGWFLSPFIQVLFLSLSLCFCF
jgi:hypothetical protein